MINKNKLKYILIQEICYLPISVIIALSTYLNHDIKTAGRVFLYTAIALQIVILISGWKVITKKNKDW